jgi:hypothetical protein
MLKFITKPKDVLVWMDGRALDGCYLQNSNLFVFPIPPLDFLRTGIFVFSKIDG